MLVLFKILPIGNHAPMHLEKKSYKVTRLVNIVGVPALYKLAGEKLLLKKCSVRRSIFRD